MTFITVAVAAALCFFGELHQALGDNRADITCCPGQNGTCYPSGPSYSHLPEPRCPDGTWPTFQLYTRLLNNTPENITSESIPPAFNPDVRTVFIVHGFMSDDLTPWVTDMKDELLIKADYNVIVVDWAKGADHGIVNFYKKAASTTRVVGSILGKLATHLATSGGADRRQMWCIGHSLGAHTCGEAGAMFRIGRVTGLDPAGPSFGDHPDIGIRQDSADFVDVIHTDQTLVVCCGDMRPRGHVDFYPNGGRKQPGCMDIRANKIRPGRLGWASSEDVVSEQRKLRGDIADWYACSHMKVTTYFTNSINHCRFSTNIECFNAEDIDSDWQKGCVKRTNYTLQVMGFSADDPNYRKEGLFYVNTADANVSCCPGPNRICYPDGRPYCHLPEPRCPDGTWPNFRLHTRHGNNTPSIITPEYIPPAYNPEARTIFIVHGFVSGEHAPWMIDMKNTLLKKGDYNVIVVDWADGAGLGIWNLYKKAASTTRVVGSFMAHIAEHLVTSGGANRTQMWCVGHSLGAHTCGEAGAAFRIGRVTGLDPAGRAFGDYPNIGIRQDSAEFVDVIHTDHPRMPRPFDCCGDIRPRGHVDFYPNGGRLQPGCSNKRKELKTKSLGVPSSEVWADEEQTPRGDIIGWFACSHMKATEYFIDSISRCHFHTNIECYNAMAIGKDWKKGCIRVGNDTLQEMGFNAEDPKYRKDGLFYVNTTEGCEGAPVAGRAATHHWTPASLLVLLLANLCIVF